MKGVLTLTTAPAALLTTAVAKTHARITVSTDDTYVDLLIAAATQAVENWTGRSLLHTVWTWTLPGWWARDEHLPRGPLYTVTHIKYLDNDGVQQTLAADQYALMYAGADKHPGLIVPAYGVAWPSHRYQENAIEVRYTAGYHASAAASVPQLLVHAVKLLIEHWYNNRQPVVTGTIVADLPFGIADLLAPYKLRDF